VDILASRADLLMLVSFPIIFLVPFDQFVFWRHVMLGQKPAALASKYLPPQTAAAPRSRSASTRACQRFRGLSRARTHRSHECTRIPLAMRPSRVNSTGNCTEG